MIRSGMWKGRAPRFWRDPHAAHVVTPAEAEATYDRIAARFPQAVV